MNNIRSSVINKLLLILLALFSLASCGSAQTKLIGSWVINHPSIECPDVVSFQSSGTYQVENDCYGNNPELPIVESGQWVMKDKSIVELYSAKNEDDYYFVDNAEIKKFRLLSLNQNTLKMCFMAVDNSCKEEAYRRLDRN